MRPVDYRNGNRLARETDPNLIVIERSLVSSAYSYPFAASWLDGTDVALLSRPTPADVAGASVALIDSVAARSFLASHAVVRAVAVAATRHSMLTFATHTRPDEVGDVVVVLDGVSLCGGAVAAIVVPEFYGITVRAWTTDPAPLDAATAIVTEGAPALIPFDDDESYQEDLGRAWFLLTDTPLVALVCLARRDLIASAPDKLGSDLGRLVTARETARVRGRELRRNLAKDFGIEREVLTDALADQSLSLGPNEERGLLELWGRSGRPLTPAERRSAFVSIG